MDKHKNFVLFLAFLLVLSLSLVFVTGATYKGSLDVDNGDGGSVSIGPGACASDWSCTLSECVEGQQTWFCTDLNHCSGATPPSNHGESQACTENTGGGSSGGSGGGGGGSSGGSSGGGGGSLAPLTNTETSNSGVCVESWVCSDWSNLENSCGERTCEDANACGTENLKPVTRNSCSGGFFSSIISFITGGVISSGDGDGGFGAGALALIVIILIAVGVVVYITKTKATSGFNKSHRLQQGKKSKGS